MSLPVSGRTSVERTTRVRRGQLPDARFSLGPVVSLKRVSTPPVVIVENDAVGSRVELDSDNGKGGNGELQEMGAVKRHYLDQFNVQYFHGLGMDWKPDVQALRRDVVETTRNTPRNSDRRTKANCLTQSSNTNVPPISAKDQVPSIQLATQVSHDSIQNASTALPKKASTRKRNNIIPLKQRPTKMYGSVVNVSSSPVVRSRKPMIGHSNPEVSAVFPTDADSDKHETLDGFNVRDVTSSELDRTKLLMSSPRTLVLSLDRTAVGNYLRRGTVSSETAALGTERRPFIVSRGRRNYDVEIVDSFVPTAEGVDLEKAEVVEVEVLSDKEHSPKASNKELMIVSHISGRKPITGNDVLLSRVSAEPLSAVVKTNACVRHSGRTESDERRKKTSTDSMELEIVEEVKRSGKEPADGSPLLSQVFPGPPHAHSKRETTPCPVRPPVVEPPDGGIAQKRTSADGSEIKIVREVKRTRRTVAHNNNLSPCQTGTVSMGTGAKELLREVEKSRQILAGNRSVNVILPSNESSSLGLVRVRATASRQPLFGMPAIFTAVCKGSTSKHLIFCRREEDDDMCSVDSDVLSSGSSVHSDVRTADRSQRKRNTKGCSSSPRLPTFAESSDVESCTDMMSMNISSKISTAICGNVSKRVYENDDSDRPSCSKDSFVSAMNRSNAPPQQSTLARRDRPRSRGNNVQSRDSTLVKTSNYLPPENEPKRPVSAEDDGSERLSGGNGEAKKPSLCRCLKPETHDKSSQTDRCGTRSRNFETSEASGDDTIEVPNLQRRSRTRSKDRRQSEIKSSVHDQLENTSSNESLVVETSYNESCKHNKDVMRTRWSKVKNRSKGVLLQNGTKTSSVLHSRVVESDESNMDILGLSDDGLDNCQKETGRSKKNLKQLCPTAQQATIVKDQWLRITGDGNHITRFKLRRREVV